MMQLIGLTRKSQCSESEADRALDMAVNAAVYNDICLPVIYGGRIIAWIFGERFPSRTVHIYRRRPGDPNTMWCGFRSIDDIIDETTNNGKMLRQQWAKKFGAGLSAFRWLHLAGIGGWPTYEAFAGTARTARQFDESSKPAIANGGNKSTDTKHLIAQWTAMLGSASTATGVAMMYDLVLSYDKCTVTNASQAMTNALTAQRYAANGDQGLRVMGLTTTSFAGSSALSVLTYTDNDGNAGQTIPNPADYGVAALGGTIDGNQAPTSAWWLDPTSGLVSALMVNLKPGDTGVQKLEDYTFAANQTGELTFLLGVPLSYCPLNVSPQMHQLDYTKIMPLLPRLYDGACPTFALYVTATSMTQIVGENIYAWG